MNDISSRTHYKDSMSEYAPMLIVPVVLLRGEVRSVGRWCWGVQLIWIILGQGSTVLAADAGRICLDIFSLAYHFSSFSLTPESGSI